MSWKHSNQPPNFEQIRQLFIEALQQRINNGEFTERGLARLCQLSQPAVHNILKGARGGSLETLDRMLRATRLDLRDLLKR